MSRLPCTAKKISLSTSGPLAPRHTSSGFSRRYVFERWRPAAGKLWGLSKLQVTSTGGEGFMQSPPSSATADRASSSKHQLHGDRILREVHVARKAWESRHLGTRGPPSTCGRECGWRKRDVGVCWMGVGGEQGSRGSSKRAFVLLSYDEAFRSPERARPCLDCHP